MTKLAYLECPTGLAGDMCLGALVHAGVPLDYLADQLKKLSISSEYHLWAEKVHRNGQQATKVHVDLLADLEAAIPSEEGIDPHTTFDLQPDTSKSQHFHVDALSYHEHPLHEHRHSEDHQSELHQPDHFHALEQPEHHNPQHADQHTHVTRHLPEIEQLIKAANLPSSVETWSLAVFRQLALAEGAVHGISPEQVHFHEVGATDAIVDIVGTCLGLEWLGIEELYCSPMPTGGGTIRAAHGQLPVPSPAVLKLWEMRQVPVYHNGIERELVTPTGAAIATTLAVQFGPPPAMTLQKVGLGAGSRNLPLPNMVRLWIGEGEGGRMKDEGRRRKDESERQKAEGRMMKAEGGSQSVNASAINSYTQTTPFHPSSFILHPSEPITLLETQIDDLNPQAIGYVFDALFAAGALDVFTQAIGMKKSRPGILLTVVCRPEQAQACEAVLFQETTTLGIRRSNQQRSILYRDIETVQTVYGTVSVKVARIEKGGAIANVQPEYEDCAKIARKTKLPWREIHRVALQSWYEQRSL